MCVGKCSRYVGLSLVLLSLLSIALQLFLLYPNFDGSYLDEGNISSHVRKYAGIWAGGLLVLVPGIQATLAGFKVRGLTCCCTCCDMLLSFVLSSVAFVGAAYCLFISSQGLKNGPYCSYQNTQTHVLEWGFAFENNDPGRWGNSDVYVFGIPVWSDICDKPPMIVPWTFSFFFLLGLVGVLQVVLSFFQ
ncbi:hypothetical protein XENTR_v10014836, partial [Xenopus tropicalis]